MPVYTDIFDPGQNTIANKQEIRLDYRVKIWIYNHCLHYNLKFKYNLCIQNVNFVKLLYNLNIIKQ